MMFQRVLFSILFLGNLSLCSEACSSEEGQESLWITEETVHELQGVMLETFGTFDAWYDDTQQATGGQAPNALCSPTNNSLTDEAACLESPNQYTHQQEETDRPLSMEDLFGAAVPCTYFPDGSGIGRAQRRIEEGPVELIGLEKMALPCRIAYLGFTNRDPAEIEKLCHELLQQNLAVCADVYTVASRNDIILEKYLENVQSLGRKTHDALKKLFSRINQQRKIFLSVTAGLETAVNEALTKATAEGDTASASALEGLETKFAAIKSLIKTAREQNDCILEEEPRLWQLNYPRAKGVRNRVNYYVPDTVSEVGEQVFKDVPALKSLFVQDASLHLDFMLLNKMTWDEMAKKQAIAPTLMDSLGGRCAQARQICHGWGVQDAWSRQKPLNFQDVKIHYGVNTIVIQDGVVAEVISPDEPQKRLATEETSEQEVSKKKRHKKEVGGKWQSSQQPKRVSSSEKK